MKHEQSFDYLELIMPTYKTVRSNCQLLALSEDLRENVSVYMPETMKERVI